MIAAGQLRQSRLYKTDWSFILGSGGRVAFFGTLSNPALFAGYQILVAFLALTLSFMRRTSKNWRIWYWGAGGLMLLAALSTAVRGSLIGIAVELLWVCCGVSEPEQESKNRAADRFIRFSCLRILRNHVRNTSLVQHSSYLNRVIFLPVPSP